MYHYPAGQVAPLPPPVGPGLGTGLTGSAGLTAPPLNMLAPGAYNMMPQYHTGLNTQATPTMLTPPTAMLTPPTTMLTPPTTMLTPPTSMLTPSATMLTPPTTMLTPPTTPLGANPALPVHISPAARITPVKPVSPVLPATPVIPGLVRPVSPVMLSQGPVMPGTFIPQPSSRIPGGGLIPMSQQPMLLPASRTATTVNLNPTPTLLAGSLQQNPAMFSQARQPVPLANGLVRDPRLGSVNYVPQPYLATMNTGAQPTASLPSSWILVESPPATSIAAAQNQPVAIQMMLNPSATNNPVLLPQSQLSQPLSTSSHVLLPQAQPPQPLSTRSQAMLPQLRTVQPELTARSQVMLPQLATATQPGPATQTVLLIPAAQGSNHGLSTVAVTQATLLDSGSQFVMQPSQFQVATTPTATDRGRQIVLQATQIPATPSVSQPSLQSTAVQDVHAGVSSSASHPVTSRADTHTARESHKANTATTHYYRTPVQQAGFPGSESDTTSLSASSSSSSL